MEQRKKIADSIVYIVLTVLAVAFLVPIFLVIMNSLKNKLYIFFDSVCAPEWR